MPARGATEALGSVRLFSSLNRRELGRIQREATVTDLPAGTQIVTEDDPGDSFYLLLDGQATVRRRGRRIATLGAGDYFGEMALLDAGPRSATVVADMPARLLMLDRRGFNVVLDEVPAVGQKMLVGMAQRLREATAQALAR